MIRFGDQFSALFNTRTPSGKNRLGKLSLAAIIAGTLGLTGCGGGGGDGDAAEVFSPIDPVNETALNGAAVDGPVKFANVTIYALDTTLNGAGHPLKGRIITTGSTDENAQIIDVNLSSDDLLEQLFLVEITGGVDILTNETPVIPTLRSVATTNQLTLNKQSIYGTPLTTLAIEIAVNKMQADSTLEWFDAIAAAQFEVRNIYGLGLLGDTGSDSDQDGVDLFTTSPIPTVDGDNEVELKLFKATETFTAIIYNVQQTQAAASSTSTNRLIELLANDLNDGVVDGMNGEEPVEVLTEIAEVATVTTTPPANIAGTDTPLNQTAALFREIAADIAPEVVVTPMDEPEVAVIIPGIDTDGNGIVDTEESCKPNLFAVFGEGTLRGQTNSIVNSDSLYTGEATLDDNGRLSFTMDQQIIAAIGATITTTGFFDIETGIGETTITNCVGSNLVCDTIDAAIGTPDATSASSNGPFTVTDENGSFFMVQNAEVDAGFDTADSNATIFFTNDCAGTLDTDRDGIEDADDAFPADAAASVDTDGDGSPDSWNEGYSAADSTTGLSLDAFPTDATESTDSDGDNVGDNSDDFPNDIAASVDEDNDGAPDAWNDGFGPEDSTSEPPLVLDTNEQEAPTGSGYTISGTGSLTGQTGTTVNSDYSFEGTAEVVDGVFQFEIDQTTELGIGGEDAHILTEGFFDLSTGLGEVTLTGCTGNSLVCDTINSDIGTPAATSSIDYSDSLDASDLSSITWSLVATIDTGDFGLADSEAFYTATLATSDLTITGSGSLVGQTVNVVDSSYVYTGTANIEGNTLSFELSQAIDNLLGLSTIVTTGFFDLTTGLGEQTATSCTGQALVCDPVTAIVGTPEATSVYDVSNSLDASDRSNISWSQILVIDTGDTGLADSNSIFTATASGEPVSSDSDNDGVADEDDAFVNDPSASVDTDGDGAPDAYNDGYSAENSTLVIDAFFDDETASVDSDGDGAPNAYNTGFTEADSMLIIDAFPDDAAASIDSDGDEYPDAYNTGKNADDTDLIIDAFPGDADEWLDSDGDMVGDNSDPFPNDASESVDFDGDNVGDAEDDAFPLDIAASVDADMDGFPDEWNTDKTEADSETGLTLDAFVGNGDEWVDADQDGYGDNLADACVSDNISIDIGHTDVDQDGVCEDEFGIDGETAIDADYIDQCVGTVEQPLGTIDSDGDDVCDLLDYRPLNPDAQIICDVVPQSTLEQELFDESCDDADRDTHFDIEDNCPNDWSIKNVNSDLYLPADDSNNWPAGDLDLATALCDDADEDPDGNNIGDTDDDADGIPDGEDSGSLGYGIELDSTVRNKYIFNYQMNSTGTVTPDSATMEAGTTSGSNLEQDPATGVPATKNATFNVRTKTLEWQEVQATD
ncbi:hypothetical protein [Oceanicoccus sagamiensis]|uniref:Uncharacterized protein n=1 Tax=Oceanicoccus sagamiensis TaxID=716816 RepID=A0A1X9NIN6_9GAMM|nr:hypothetical protein [Oceanicoccus sagamiensis]ARN75705.1 hypothetical protein BST96_17280 [Oceanicoccus sagamiensis]